MYMEFTVHIIANHLARDQRRYTGGMIEHYSLHAIKDLTDRFKLTNGVPKGVRPRYNISPTQPAPVIIKNGDATELRTMTWGLLSQGAKNANSIFRYKTFNTKSEKVFAKASRDTAIRHQRCIIPVDGFYMIRSDTRDAYYFTDSAQPVMALGGIYTSWTDTDNVEHYSYSLLTIEANDAMPLPFARMPVLLHSEDETGWLDTAVTGFSDVLRMMRPYEAGVLNHAKVSGDVALAKNDTPDLFVPKQS